MFLNILISVICEGKIPMQCCFIVLRPQIEILIRKVFALVAFNLKLSPVFIKRIIIGKIEAFGGAIRKLNPFDEARRYMCSRG